MTQAELLARLIDAGSIDGYDIDQHCYYYAQVTGTPCPAPEDFGAGDRTRRYSVATFIQMASQFGHSWGVDSEPPIMTVTPPTGGGGGPVPPTIQPNPIRPNGQQPISMTMILVIGVAVWLLWE